MKLLILGGTGFFGRHLTEVALARGHQVTLFNRGKTGPHLFPGIDRYIGDRVRGLGALAGRRWDAAIDTCGHTPEVVSESAVKLAGAADCYAFVSSVSVYSGFAAAHLGEDAPVRQRASAEPSTPSPNTFGLLKVECEREVKRLWPGRALLIRPGTMTAPHDPTGRVLWWLLRLARGGEVLAPGRAERALQLIDARDLAVWLMTLLERGVTGTFNVTGPSEPLTMGGFLEACRAIVGSSAQLVWLDDLFLLACGVQPWSELPLWSVDDDFGTVSSARAVAAGLRCRALADTLRDTFLWALHEHASLPHGVGLDAEQEAAILGAWHRVIAEQQRSTL